MHGVALTDKLDGMFHSRFIWFCHWYNLWIEWVERNRMLIDKNKNKDKVMTQTITKVAVTASWVKLGGNITCAQICQKHSKVVNMEAVTSPSVISQSTIRFFLWKVTPHTHMSIVLCHQLCFLAGVLAQGVCQFYIYYTTIFSGHFYLCKHYFLWSVYLVRSELKKNWKKK